jgi:hypothetical protein
MTQHFALLSVVFMMAFVVLFAKVHDRHKHGFGLVALMPRAETDRIFRILVACQES